MDELNKHDNDNASVRKALKESRRVKASPDFEARLQRRIAESREVPALSRFWESVRLPNRIPAFAYSLATVVVLSVASYYVFFRTGDVPKQESPRASIAEKLEKPTNVPESGADRDRSQTKEESEIRQIPIEKGLAAAKPAETERKKQEPAAAGREMQNAPLSVPAPTPRTDEAAKAAVQEIQSEGAKSKDAKWADQRKGAVLRGMQDAIDTAAGNVEFQAAPISRQVAAPQQPLQKQTTVPPMTTGPSAPQQQVRKLDNFRSAERDEGPLSARIKDSLRVDSLKRIKHIADSLKRAADSLKSIRSKKDD